MPDPAQVQSFAGTSGALGVALQSAPPAADTAAGNALLAFVTLRLTTGAPFVESITDTGGNTGWRRLTQIQSASGHLDLEVWLCPAANTIAAAGGAVTVSTSAACTIDFEIEEVSNLGPNPIIDILASQEATASTAPTAGPTAQSDYAPEIAFAAVAWNSAAVAASGQSAGWQLNATHTSNPAGQGASLQVANQVNDAETTLSFGSTLSASSTWLEVIVGLAPTPSAVSTRTLILTLGPRTLDLNDYLDTGIVVSSVDLGAPAVSESVTDLPTQDGVDDQTKYLRQRVVTIAGSIGAGAAGSRSKVAQLLAPFLAPSARPTLTYALDNDAPLRTLALRASQWSYTPRSGADFAFQAQWKGDPYALGLTTNEVDLAPFSSTAGRTYPRAFPTVYPPPGGTGLGTTTVNSAGGALTWPVYRIYGPVTNPAIALLDPDGNVIGNIPFLNLNVTTGNYLEINTKARTVTLNGSAGASRYSFLDFSNLIWTPLAPGANTVRFSASSASTPAMAAVRWQDAYLF